VTFPRTPSELISRMNSKRRPRPELSNDLLPPRDAVEQTLAEVWSEVLGIRDVGISDNFFVLGGDSLHMTQIASRLRQRCGVEVSFVDFFENPTIMSLAELIRMTTGNSANDGAAVNGVISVPPTAKAEQTKSMLATEAASAPMKSEKRGEAIRTIAIPTRNRPSELRRCLIELLQNLNRYGHAPNVLIADGSSDGSSDANQQVVHEVSVNTGQFNIVLMRSNDKKKALDRLVNIGVDRDILEFSLNGLAGLELSSTGANRNALLLATAGETFLGLDDDTELQFAKSPRFRPSMEYWEGKHYFGDDPAELDFYHNRDSLLSSIQFTDLDFLGTHQELLGREFTSFESPGELMVARYPEEYCTSGPAGHKVLMTINGMVGDCGWGTPSRFLFVDEASFKRLAECEQSYLNSTSSRQMLRVAPNYRLTTRARNLMTAAFGADGRLLLPPFVPVGRGEDVIFGQLLERVQLNGGFAHLPWAILHSPIESRQFWPGEILRSAATTDLKGVFCGLLSSLPANPDSTAESSMRSIGKALVEIASQHLSDFQSTLRQIKNQNTSQDIAALESRLDQDYAATPSCLQDIGRYIQLLEFGRNQPTSGVPSELLYDADLEQAIRSTQKIVLYFGRLLYVWPDIVKAASDMRQHGFLERLGNGVG
jgi:aryl carrier-like protein